MVEEVSSVDVLPGSEAIWASVVVVGTVPEQEPHGAKHGLDATGEADRYGNCNEGRGRGARGEGEEEGEKGCVEGNDSLHRQFAPSCKVTKVSFEI